MSLGQKIIDYIITGKLFHATSVEHPDDVCRVVWSSGAEEQLDALLASPPNKILASLALAMEEWPPQTVVWHRACGTRGIVVEYSVNVTGHVVLMVSYKGEDGYERSLPAELSKTRVQLDSDDEWRGGETV